MHWWAYRKNTKIVISRYIESDNNLEALMRLTSGVYGPYYAQNQTEAYKIAAKHFETKHGKGKQA